MSSLLGHIFNSQKAHKRDQRELLYDYRVVVATRTPKKLVKNKVRTKGTSTQEEVRV